MSKNSMEITRHDSTPLMSPVVEVPTGPMVVISGQVADQEGSGIEQQTREVLRKVDDLLAKAGSERTKVFAANIWLTDMQNFAQMNEVWKQWVSEESAPARVCVEARLPQPAALVEVQVWAMR